MADFDLESNPKQGVAYLCLNDNIHSEIGYAGAAGAGKSYLGCAWIIINCTRYKGVRYLIGRRELTNLKKTTLMTFFQVCNSLGLQPNIHYNYNGQLNVIEFFNRSQVLLMDMAHKPSDPDYLRFGGLELTGAFVDESNECDIKALDILKTRLGRCLNDKYDLKPKLFETFNPSKNHVYSRFWIPYKNKTMPKYRIFVPALATDNPFLSKEYIKQLKNADEITRQRLLHGNFEYDDDERSLVTYSQISDCFSNSFVSEGKKRISTDLAMQGRDNFVISLWSGLRVKFILIKSKATGKEIEEDLKKSAEKNSVTRSNIVADSDGMGAYLESYIRGIEKFHANQKPYDPTYGNLKNQCAFKLAEFIRKGEFFIDIKDDQYVVIGGRSARLKDIISEELGQLKIDNASIDKDQKKRIISKDEMKQNIGRSPDFLDCLIQGMLFYVKNSNISVIDGSGIL